MKVNEKLQQQISSVPKKPGVYQYYDVNDKILYIGKAKNLKSRVLSYFNNDKAQSGKTRVLVRKIKTIRYIITETEMDALLLENSLIKKHQPRYNVMLKDDKTYPWICIKNEPFPRVFKTRTLIKDGSEYYGPYASVSMMNTILDLVRKNYKLRTCNYLLSEENIEKKKFRRCLEYHIGNCKAPCEGLETEAEYESKVEEIRKILKGNVAVLKKELKTQMMEAAENLNFELAEELKQKWQAFEKFQAKSTVVSPHIHNVDVFSFLEDKDTAYVNYMRVHSGAIIQGHTLELKKKIDETPETLLEIAITELRERFNSNSKEIIVPFTPLVKIEGIDFHIPQRGDKRKLLELSERNAKYFKMESRKQQLKTNPERHSNRILEGMQKDLRLTELPKHIECFDNSNIQGNDPVSACVVFRNAKPSKREYRHFNIKTVEGPNDFASMTEVVYRRYKRLLYDGEDLPQLIVVDGGKGQLSAALKSLDELGLRGKIAIIGIAERLEEIFYPGDKYPLYLDKRSETLKVIQHLRNEAHRFGITHHRNLRSKNSIKSELDLIDGIGEKSKNALFLKFKSVKRIKEANLEELKSVLTEARAKLIYNYFQEN